MQGSERFFTRFKSQQRNTTPYSIILFFTFIVFPFGIMTKSAYAYVDDECPDEGINAGQSINIFIEDITTGEISSVTNGVSPGKTIRVHSMATAFGSCQQINYNPSTQECVPSLVYERDVNQITLNIEQNTEDGFSSNVLGHVNSSEGSQHIIDSRDASTSGGVNKFF